MPTYLEEKRKESRSNNFFRLPRVSVYCKPYKGSKPTYVCQHVATDWLVGKVLWTEEMSTHDRLLMFWTCVEPSLWGLSTLFLLP